MAPVVDPVQVNFDALAVNVTQRMLGSLEVSNALKPTLSGILSDLFTLTNQICPKGDWLGIALGATADTSDVGNAYRIAEILTGLLPASLLQQTVKSLSNIVPPKQPMPAVLPSDTSPIKDTLKDFVQQLKKVAEPTGSTATLAIGSLTNMQQNLLKSVTASIPTPGGGAKWDPVKVVRQIQQALRDALKQISDANMPGENSKAVAAEIEAELTGPLERRLFVALGLTTYGALMYGVGDLQDLLNPPSGGTFGTEVHQRLQIEYRKPRPENTIVQESTLYFKGSGTPLVKAQSWDPNLYALSIARGALLTQIQTAIGGQLSEDVKFSLRDDNLDLTLGTEWEIKPIRGAALGVLQEMLYRSLYNIVAAFIKDIPTLVPIKIGATLKGLVTSSHLRGGTQADWPEISIEKVRLIGGFGRLSRKWISLVTVDSLPGLLLYFTYDLPVGVIVFADALQRLMNKIGKTLDKGFPILVEGIAFAFMVMAAIIIVVGLIVALVSGAGELAAAAAAVVEVLAPVLALLNLKGAELVDLVRKLAEQVAPLVSQYGLNVSHVDSSATGEISMRFSLNADTPPEEVPCDDATFGPLHLQNAPMAILASMPGLFALGVQISGAVIQKRVAAVPPLAQA